MQTSRASLLCPLLPPLLHLHFHLLFLLQQVRLLAPPMPKMCQTALWQGHAALGQTQSLFSRLSVAQTRVWAVQPWAALQMPEEKTRKGETAWLAWGSGKTTAKEATFHCTGHCRQVGISSVSSAAWEEFVLQPSTVCSLPVPLSLSPAVPHVPPEGLCSRPVSYFIVWLALWSAVQPSADDTFIYLSLRQTRNDAEL